MNGTTRSGRRPAGLLATLVALALLAPGACGDIVVASGEETDAADAGGDDGPDERLLYTPTSCDPDLATRVGGRWVTLDDRVNGGKSESVMAIERDPTGACFLRWSGALRESPAGPEANAMTVADGVLRLDQFAELVIQTRGDGAPIRIELPREDQWQAANSDAPGDHWNFHGAVFGCGDGSGTWGETVVRLDALTQEEGWGEPWERDNAQVRRLILRPDADAPFEWSCELGDFFLRR